MRIRKLYGFNLTIGFLLCLAVTAAFGAQEANERVVLKGVTFKNDSAILQKESENSLNKLLEELRADPLQRIIIEGHTNATGDDRKDGFHDCGATRQVERAFGRMHDFRNATQN